MCLVADEIDSAFRQVKGVMRIGAVAKGMLLAGDKVVELAVLCQDRPTKTLLARVFKALSQQMAEITTDRYNYEVKVEDCAIIVTSQDAFRMQLKASLTSTCAAEDEKEQTKVNHNLLNRSRCLGKLLFFLLQYILLFKTVIRINVAQPYLGKGENLVPFKLWSLEMLFLSELLNIDRRHQF